MDSGQYPPISPDRTKVSLTLAKVFILAGTLVFAGVTVGKFWADQELKFRGMEARLGDMPTRQAVRSQIEELAGPDRIREVLRAAKWQCPLYVGRGKATWVECRIVFPPERPK